MEPQDVSIFRIRPGMWGSFSAAVASRMIEVYARPIGKITLPHALGAFRTLHNPPKVGFLQAARGLLPTPSRAQRPASGSPSGQHDLYKLHGSHTLLALCYPEYPNILGINSDSGFEQIPPTRVLGPSGIWQMAPALHPLTSKVPPKWGRTPGA